MQAARMTDTLIHQGYAGDVLPGEAWKTLSQDTDAMLVDVRTNAEWAFSGVPHLQAVAKEPVLVSWRLYPDFVANPQFASQVASRIPQKDAPIFFLCKTGGRSREAAEAMTAQGYTQCYNIRFGFEGDANEQGQRGRVNGWKAEQLPWVQA